MAQTLARSLKNLRQRLSYAKKALFATGTQSPVFFEHRAKFPDIRGTANLIPLFAGQIAEGTPKPEFASLFRQVKTNRNPESIEADTAYLLYYVTRLVKAKTVIEVGIYRGAGSLHLAQGLVDNGGGELHLIDISKSYLTDVKKKISAAKLPVKIKTHCGYSHEVAVGGTLPVADIIFIDANHRYDAVKNDFQSYWPLLKTNGILLIHDTVMWEGARTFANELCAKGFPIITLATGGGAGVSLIRKES